MVKLLLIDDDERFLFGLSELLRKNSYEVEIARNGTEGLAKLREIEPDIVVCDLMMPAPNGYDISRALKEDSRTASIPMILMSGLSGQADISQGLCSGADAFIIKPFDPELFFAHLEVQKRRLVKSSWQIKEEERLHEEIKNLQSGLHLLTDVVYMVENRIHIDLIISVILSKVRAILGAGAVVLDWQADEKFNATKKIDLKFPHTKQILSDSDAGYKSDNSRLIWKTLVSISNQQEGVLSIYADKDILIRESMMGYFKVILTQLFLILKQYNIENNLLEIQTESEIIFDRSIDQIVSLLSLRDEDSGDHSRRVADMTVGLARKYNLPEQELPLIRRGALLHDIGKVGIPDIILLKKSSLGEREWKILRQHPKLALEVLHSMDASRVCLDIPLYHHERWDGSGYPFGLVGDAIPITARLFALVDMWDALTTDRPYRLRSNREDAIRAMRAESGSHFQPELVDLFFEYLAQQE